MVRWFKNNGIFISVLAVAAIVAAVLIFTSQRAESPETNATGNNSSPSSTSIMTTGPEVPTTTAPVTTGKVVSYPRFTTSVAGKPVNTSPILGQGVAGAACIPLPDRVPKKTVLLRQAEKLLSDYFTYRWSDTAATRKARVAPDVSAPELKKFDFSFSFFPQYAQLIRSKHLSAHAIPQMQCYIAFPDDHTLQGIDLRIIVQLSVVDQSGSICSQCGRPYQFWTALHWSYHNGKWHMDDSKPFQ